MVKKTILTYPWDQITSICIVFCPKIGKIIFDFFGHRIFSKIWKNFVSNFCGACSHKMLTLMDQSPMDFLVLSLGVLWKTGWTEIELKCKSSSPNPVPEGHCQITIKCTNYYKTLKIRNKLSWKRLIQGQLLPWGHACPLGGRVFRIKINIFVLAGVGAPGLSKSHYHGTQSKIFRTIF